MITKTDIDKTIELSRKPCIVCGKDLMHVKLNDLHLLYQCMKDSVGSEMFFISDNNLREIFSYETIRCDNGISYKRITGINPEKLSNNQVWKIYNNVNWFKVSEFENNEHLFEINEDFLHRYRHKVLWYIVCETLILSEKFIIEHKDYVNWRRIMENQKIHQFSPAFWEIVPEKYKYFGTPDRWES